MGMVCVLVTCCTYDCAWLARLKHCTFLFEYLVQRSSVRAFGYLEVLYRWNLLVFFLLDQLCFCQVSFVAPFYLCFGVESIRSLKSVVKIPCFKD